jgi:hypothetical protein
MQEKQFEHISKNKIHTIDTLLYSEDIEEVKRSILKMEDQGQLYLYAYNYNWDNGFEIPQLILDNPNCDLGIALLVFYRADGMSYLTDKCDNRNLPQWSSFIKNLYDLILAGRYHKAEIGFTPPLSRVELFKLKKQLSEAEYVFIEKIEGQS